MAENNYVKILRLGAPILVGQLGMIVVGFADSAMVGHYSTDALAAASFVNNVFNIAILMCLGFTYGLTPLVGSLFSVGKDDEIGATLRRGIKLNIAFGLLVTAVMGCLYLNLDRLGQPDHLLPLIKPYFLIYLGGILSVSVFQTFAQWAYAINSSKMPMWIILATNAVNIIGNYIFIYGKLGMPEMGLMGAGLSTIISRWLAPILIIIIFMKVGRYRRYHNGFFRVTTCVNSYGRLFRTSIPVSLQLGFETSAFSIAAVMVGWLGGLELASYQIIVTIGTLGFCIYYGMGAAVSVIVANAAGRGDRREMRRVAFAGYHIIIALAVVASLTFMVLGRTLIGIFTDDSQVIAMTLTLIVPLMLYQLSDATQVTFSNALRGTANVMPMLWIALLSYIAVGIPSTYLLAFTFRLGIVGVVISFSVSLFCAGALFFAFFMKTTRHAR